jgi:hypothetical protein
MVVPVWVSRFFNFFSQILNIVTGIQTQQAAQATEAEQQLVLSTVNTIQTELTDATNGLTAIKNAIDDLATLVGTNDTSILAAIANIPVTGAPITLPSTFPSGWNTPLGDAVWGWPVPAAGNNAWTFLQHAGDGAIQRGEALVEETTPYADALWVVTGVWGFDDVGAPNPNSTVTLDVTTILASDATSIDWLNRVYPTVPWLGDLQNGTKAVNDLTNSNWSWNVDLPIDKWLQLKANLGLTAAVSLAPVWPGLAAVTLGTPVAISSSFTVPGPMHGVLVDITAILANKPFFDFDGSLSYRNIGALAFNEDNGDEEFPQNLGFTSAVYCPKSMKIAANCVVRADASITGTVTPWVIT